MSSEEDFEADMALEDDGAVALLTPFYGARPARSAWRSDPDAAPAGKPVYVREANSVCVQIGVRDEQGWAAIRRDGQVRSLEAVAAWAPLAAAIA
jgi:hypothetical protein